MGFVCKGSIPLDLSSDCVRSFWSTVLPAVLVVLFTLYRVPLPSPISKALGFVTSPLTPFLTLEEAEALDASVDKDEDDTTHHTTTTTATGIPLWRTIVLVWLALAETLVWLSIAAFSSFLSASHPIPPSTHPSAAPPNLFALLALLTSLSWLYATIRPIAIPSATLPFDLLALYAVHFVLLVLKVGGAVYDVKVLGIGGPNGLVVLGWGADAVALVVLLGVLWWTPLGIPSARVDRAEIGKSVSPEDYTTLGGWTTFFWIYPLIKRGTNDTLNETDVWNLSPTMQSRPVFMKFSATKRNTLLRRLWAANSLDLILDFTLTFISVVFNYASPFFLRRILEAIDDHTELEKQKRSQAYVYAGLAFLCTVAKAQADVQHLWYGRRACTHIRTELMASIYDKALKRKDFSGIVDQDALASKALAADDARALRAASQSNSASRAGGGTATTGAGVGTKQMSKEERKKAEDKRDESKAGADVGKIVNLMAGDANRCAMMISGIYFIYGAPFEIIIASVFLYQLLGISAFAGFIVLLLGWPLNSFIARRSIRIQKGVMAARDRRMGVLNELIGAVKFIKFFAWEDRWIERALDAREAEMKWMIKARVNSVLFSALWTTAPILVSIISFWVYVMRGNELSVSVAFTAIALFNMIRAPLNVIPAWIVQILQTGVALNRISVYLNEDEVDEQVSSLKRTRSGGLSPSSADGEDTDKEGLGFKNASFKWNEVEEKKKDDAKDKGTKTNGHSNGTNGTNRGSHDTDATLTLPTSSADTNPRTNDEEAAERESITGGGNEHRFELRDLNVVFPEGELTVVTGPTASGKTALLMALLGEMTMLPTNPPGKLIMHKDPHTVDPVTHLTHTISYAAQSPWLRHQSIKENILFGYPYDEKRYEEVVESCALGPDLKILEDGDETEIGARGVSLSGGQKARVALARAVYAPTKYVLLDDPLSAVDSHTARFLFEKLLKGPLLANRTVILVTHHVELVLPGTHYLIRMLDGRIDTHGTVAALREQGILEAIEQESEVQVVEEEKAVAEEMGVGEKTAEEEAVEGAVDGNEEGGEEEAVKKAKGKGGKKPRKLVKDEQRLTGGVKWPIYKTYLKASSYWTWIGLASLIVLAQLLGVTEKLWIKFWGEAYGEDNVVASTTTYSFTSFSAVEHESLFGGSLTPHYLPHAIHSSHHIPHVYAFNAFNFSDTVRLPNITTTSPYTPTSQIVLTNIQPSILPSAKEHPLFYIGVYAGIGFLTALVSILSVVTQYTGALRASRVLFRKLLETVVRATMRWHDTTPQGRMLNRFSKDVETVDSSLAGSLQAVNTSLATFAASVLTVAFIFPLFLIPASIIGLAYRQFAIGYLNTGRDLRRMESNTRSPIFSGFGELLEGIVTVRAFSAEQKFLDGLHQKIDQTTKMWYSFWMTNRWLLLNFDCLGAVAVLITTLFALSGFVSAGTAGMCITSAMAFTTSIYWACRFWTALELDLNSVERVVEYLDLPQEPPAIIENNRPPAYWPSSESENLIVVENLDIKYAPELPPVLHDVSFSLKAKERIGLLGRTGSGKSTLAMSILRFVDPAGGRILVDGIDISTIGLHDLRSRITFIPQDATLFSGTLRENLDPFNEHDDLECLDVLYRVQMLTENAYESQRTSRQASRANTRPSSPSHPDRPSSATPSSSPTVGAPSVTEVESRAPITLDTQVSPGGINFSQGQRQLIAMARALLRRSAIIVLDEATSSIDFATDAKIQATIREEFGGSLLLTVAHRLRTVIDYDRLIVLEKGAVAEFDTPTKLLEKEDGIFRTMCLKSGMFAELEAAAKEKASRDIPS